MNYEMWVKGDVREYDPEGKVKVVKEGGMQGSCSRDDHIKAGWIMLRDWSGESSVKLKRLAMDWERRR